MALSHVILGLCAVGVLCASWRRTDARVVAALWLGIFALSEAISLGGLDPDASLGEPLNTFGALVCVGVFAVWRPRPWWALVIAAMFGIENHFHRLEEIGLGHLAALGLTPTETAWDAYYIRSDMVTDLHRANWFMLAVMLVGPRWHEFCRLGNDLVRSAVRLHHRGFAQRENAPKTVGR